MNGSHGDGGNDAAVVVVVVVAAEVEASRVSVLAGKGEGGNAVQAAAELRNNGVLTVRRSADGAVLLSAPVADTEWMRLGPSMQLWNNPSAADMQVALKFHSEESAELMDTAVRRLRRRNHAGTQQGDSSDTFDARTEASCAEQYFQYYGQLMHQQNMLQDFVRTGTYYSAVLENPQDFAGKLVLDVGAGSGILSFFAAQAGAKKVYAVEASDMAQYAKTLAMSNGDVGSKIEVLHKRVEAVELPQKVDVIISEPMGILLFNERMLESYLVARDKHLKPGGLMFPAIGRIHLAPFSDDALFAEVAAKAQFWQTSNFYGVDLTPLYNEASEGYFSQPVVDAFDPALLIAQPIAHTTDFRTASLEDLQEIRVPFSFIAQANSWVHGLACWFDVLFDGSQAQRCLSTAPGLPTTHWFQLRCLLMRPLTVAEGQAITGTMVLKAHSRQSYDIQLEMATAQGAQTAYGTYNLKEPYYRQAMSYYNQLLQQQQQQWQQQYQGYQQQLQQLQQPVAAVNAAWQQPRTQPQQFKQHAQQHSFEGGYTATEYSNDQRW